MEQKRKIKIVVIVLVILIVLSIFAIVGTLLYNKMASNKKATVEVPNNLISSGGVDSSTKDDNSSVSSSNEDQNVTSSDDASLQKATAITLYNKQPHDNAAFAVDNMFPGDSVSKYYSIAVTHSGDVTVCFKANVRSGYEKLAEALNAKVILLNTDTVLYDGLMCNMPDSLTHDLDGDKSKTDTLYYEIIAYLNTSVGSEYQNQNLIADFNWWVAETDNLDKLPQTGDIFRVAPWITVIVISVAILIVLFVIRKKREGKQR